MKQTDWKIIYTNYAGPEKRAVNFLSKEAGRYIIREVNVYRIHVLPCEKEGSALSKNAIFVSLYDKSPAIQKLVAREEVPANGFLVKVIPNPDDAEGRLVILTAFDPVNLYYAAVSFIDDYIPRYGKISGSNPMTDLTFDEPLAECCYTQVPNHKTRSIFTWGHSFNDYRAYIDNMARQHFNELILWNDFVPLNIDDIIDYAHSYGIAVNLGYSWGWGTHQCADTTSIDDETLGKLKNEIVAKYDREYAQTGCDGIYFQSFTEQERDYIGGRLIAEAVTSLVNMTAKEILKRNPKLKLQFGLHASSVRTHLDEITKVDPRIEILWEDCGEFPYGYDPYVKSEDAYTETLEFTKKLLNLRGGKGVGLVFKGVMMLDWKMFLHQAGPYVMGENHRDIALHDRQIRAKGWQGFSADWVRNGDRVAQMVKFINENKLGEVNMCLAGTLDGGIYLPMALCAQMYWNCSDSFPDLLKTVMQKPCITTD